MDISERLKAERERLGLSQEAFGLVGGVQKRAQIHYEKGERNPDSAYLAAIAGIGADVLYILTGDRDMEPPPAMSADEQVMLQYYREAAPAVRKAALGALVGAMPGEAAKAPSVKVGIMNSSASGSVQVGYAGGSVSVKTSKKK